MDDLEDILLRVRTLPRDPEVAFVELCKIIKTRADERGKYDSHYGVYYDILTNFASSNGINLPEEGAAEPYDEYVSRVVTRPRTRDDHKLEVLAAIHDYEVGTERFGYAEISPDERKRLGELIGEMKHVIESCELTDGRKYGLLARLDKLRSDISANHIYTDKFVGFYSDLRFTYDRFGADPQRMKMPFQVAKETIRLVMSARARTEGITLPKRCGLPDFFKELG